MTDPKYILLQPPELAEAVLNLAEQLRTTMPSTSLPGTTRNTVVFAAFQLVNDGGGDDAPKVAFNGLIFGCCSIHLAAKVNAHAYQHRDHFKVYSPCGRLLQIGATKA